MTHPSKTPWQERPIAFDENGKPYVISAWMPAPAATVATSLVQHGDTLMTYPVADAKTYAAALAIVEICVARRLSPADAVKFIRNSASAEEHPCANAIINLVGKHGLHSPKAALDFIQSGQSIKHIANPAADALAHARAIELLDFCALKELSLREAVPFLKRGISGSSSLEVLKMEIAQVKPMETSHAMAAANVAAMWDEAAERTNAQHGVTRPKPTVN